MASFAGWVRNNSEHYLMEAAQHDVAERHLQRRLSRPRAGATAVFWRHVFVPIYRRLPWQLRSRIIALMPGSHRRQWPRRPPLQR